MQRQGYLYRDVARMVKNDRDIFASCMLALGHGNALITGLTRNYNVSLENITRVIDTNAFLFGVTLVVAKGKTLFFADTTAGRNRLMPEQLAHIAVKNNRAGRPLPAWDMIRAWRSCLIQLSATRCVRNQRVSVKQ